MSVKTIKKGVHRVFWRNETNIQRNKTIHGEKALAQAFERDMLSEVARKKWDLPNCSNENSEKTEPKRYREFLVEFCERHKAEHSETNAHSHLNAGIKLIKLAGDLPLNEYTTEHLLALRMKMLKRGLAPRTVNKTVAHIKTQFRHAEDLGHIERNPCASRLLKPLPEHSLSRRALGLEQLREIVRLADPPYDQILTISYTTGLRVGELFRARIEDICGNTLIIPRAKNRKPRQVPLLAEALGAIEALKGKRTKGPLITTHENGRSFRSHLAIILKIAYYRFTHDGANPPTRMRSWIQKNVPDITTQDLRHSFISILRAGNVDSEIRARIAGHTRQVDESIYTHYMESTLIESMERGFNTDNESMEESLGVCRAVLEGRTVANISNDSRRLLRELLQNLRGLVEGDEIPAQEQASGAVEFKRKGQANSKNVSDLFHIAEISEPKNAEEIV